MSKLLISSAEEVLKRLPGHVLFNEIETQVLNREVYLVLQQTQRQINKHQFLSVRAADKVFLD